MSQKREPTRADAVRQRRAQQNTQRITQAAERAYRAAPMVTSRRLDYVSVKHKRASNRRRFNIALGVPDLHWHRPTITFPRLHAGWRLASFFVTLTLGAALYYAWTLPYFRAAWATTLGNNRLTAEEINAVMGVTGQSIFMIQPDELETRIRLNYPELASAEVNVYLPNHVYVNVTERQPVILWQQGEGYTWIDATGVAFRPRGQVEGLIPVTALDVPPAGAASPDDPLNPPPYVSKELVDAILLLAPSLPAGLSMIYDPQHGLGWNDSRGWRAFFGTNPKDMALKVHVYQALVDSLMARGLYPEFINVAYPEGPYYRMAESEITSDSNE